jgi:hypothetical protein
MSLPSSARRLRHNTPSGIVEIFEENLSHFLEAKRRITEEGQVVRDLRGAVVPHPSLEIQREHGKIMLEILKKHGDGASDSAMDCLDTLEFENL